VELSFDNLKVPRDMLTLSRELGVSWQEWALHGGEEYELLFAASKSFSPEDVPKEFRRRLIRLGVFTDKHSDIVLLESGRKKIIPKKGWDHIAKTIKN
jgi:thiamine monophosphate kinase